MFHHVHCLVVIVHNNVHLEVADIGHNPYPVRVRTLVVEQALYAVSAAVQKDWPTSNLDVIAAAAAAVAASWC